MTKELLVKALAKLLLGAVIMGALLFVAAGSLQYWNGWVLLGALFVPMSIVGATLLFREPELLQKRLNSRETDSQQRVVVAANALLFILVFVVSGLGWRLGWYMFPRWMVWVALILFLAAYLMYAEVLRENSYLSRTIEVRQEQKVIDTGLYGIVRHPMYTSSIVLFVMMPVILGSPVATAAMLLYIPLIIMRIKLEEKLLDRELKGYIEYKRKVRYRLFPFIW
ncbi:MAG: isoprenylcysteine carboxylmethyltransferase family protein [Rikenellaceae bacterium]|nr:isoprenylcysteine carboxylmethyltransferase family protein [Rikenellaceae bacterium]